ncbi:MAG TPA: hypothetical protein VH394_11245 [Thermoanaerobaculia bacterium]|nr:hypothetical protein [Thermoanaerobaculia bacterium]
MTREEYEARKRQLEEERRAGVELVEASYQVQLRALETLWAGGSQTPAREPSQAPPPQPAPRRRLGQVYEDVMALYWKLPAEFDRNDVCQALGYEPDRNTLFRILTELVQDGKLVMTQRGGGRVPTRYSRPGAGSRTPPA